MPTKTTTEILECTACGQSTKDGLELMPSGKNFRRHEANGERCTGGQPKTSDPEPVLVAPRNGKNAECQECGEEHPALKSEGRVRKHMNPQTLEVCEQRASVEAPCPVCDATRTLRKMRLPIHNDMRTRTRCPGSNKTMSEAAALKKTAPAAKKMLPRKSPNPKAGTAVPKARKTDTYKALSPLDKSRYKATRLGKELAEYPDPWDFTVENGEDADQATLVLTRGKGDDTEEMRISWWGGACLGGEGRITHAYKGRTIAVRNANAVRMRARLTHESVAEEHKRVSTKKANPTPRKRKTPEQLKALMPFDPATAENKEILAAIRNKTIRWENKTSGKTEEDVVKSGAKITKTKTGRNLTFQGQSMTRTVRVENLVGVA